MPRLSGLMLLLFCSAVVSDDTINSQLNEEAQQLAQRFVGELKPQLKRAMLEGGPVYAVEVCASVAPSIADNLAAESGWQVNRVSLKSRNASRAQPDKWEQAVLVQFDERQAAGEEASALVHADIEGGWYRYMQAQVVEPLCLACHGTDLAEPVRVILNDFYPDDWATGYRLGQVRGAISLARQVSLPDEDRPESMDAK
jgi:hypothetical protein